MKRDSHVWLHALVELEHRAYNDRRAARDLDERIARRLGVLDAERRVVEAIATYTRARADFDAEQTATTTRRLAIAGAQFLAAVESWGELVADARDAVNYVVVDDVTTDDTESFTEGTEL